MQIALEQITTKYDIEVYVDKTSDLLKAIDGWCRCDSVGSDDGRHTCWQHHDCTLGDCTHNDGDEY